jgi:hypothetical protein
VSIYSHSLTSCMHGATCTNKGHCNVSAFVFWLLIRGGGGEGGTCTHKGTATQVCDCHSCRVVLCSVIPWLLDAGQWHLYTLTSASKPQPDQLYAWSHLHQQGTLQRNWVLCVWLRRELEALSPSVGVMV